MRITEIVQSLRERAAHTPRWSRTRGARLAIGRCQEKRAWHRASRARAALARYGSSNPLLNIAEPAAMGVTLTEAEGALVPAELVAVTEQL